MKKTLMALIFLTATILSGCKEEIKGAPAVGTDTVVPEFTWKVRSQHDLETIYRTNGQMLTERDKLHGFVGIDPDGSYVIYTPAPSRVDDQVTCTLGHEVMHIALGNYHD